MVDASDVTRWIGVSIAFTGTLAASPAATTTLAAQTLAPLHRAAQRTRDWLGRWVPWLRRNKPILVTTGASLVAVASLSATGQVRIWGPSLSTEQKIEQLHDEIEHLHDLLRQHADQVIGELHLQDEAINVLRQEIRLGLDELRHQVADAENKATNTDARVLPVVGLGVVLTGIPDELARFPLPVWLLGMSLAVAGSVYVILRSWRVRPTLVTR